MYLNLLNLLITEREIYLAYVPIYLSCIGKAAYLLQDPAPTRSRPTKTIALLSLYNLQVYSSIRVEISAYGPNARPTYHRLLLLGFKTGFF